MKLLRRALVGTLVIVVGWVLVGSPLTVRLAAPAMNPVFPPPTTPPSTDAERIHRGLTVADLHADALLWDKNLLRSQGVGQVDLPRLVEGRVGLQLFTVVTKTPWSMNIESNSANSDQVTLLSLVEAWPPRTWTSLTERALHQAAKLRRTAERSDGALVVVTTRSELEALFRDRRPDDRRVAGILGIEGAHALEGSLENLDRAYEAGFRMIGLTHFFDNEIGGSAHGVEKGGLTELGREAIPRMEALGIAVDLAHAAPALIDDVLEIATEPLIVSHTGVKATCDNRRNLDDERLARIAATGGVVGIGLWPTAVCGETPEAWATAVRHAVDVAGVDHVGLGSDWDGVVEAIVDPSGTVFLTDALLREGFDDEEIVKIMGGNVLRVFLETLPE